MRSRVKDHIPDAQVLGDVWREACRHLELRAALASISVCIDKIWPIARLTILDFDRTRLTILSIGAEEPESRPELATCTLASMKRLCAWSGAGRVARVAELRRDLPNVAQVVSSTLREGTLLGGLAGAHGARGMLVIEPNLTAPLRSEHRRFATALLEPLSVALDNHHRLRELIELRAAAEADTQTLLKRLGRDAVGDSVIGAEDGLKAVFDRVSKVCKSDLPVLILGETGAGKEVVAREIHMRSPRKDAAFIRVNCGAIPSELIDSELFGHEKGSFTGATSQRLGWFERAHLGTLFLDEVAELSLAAQVRLLRVLQDGLIQRVGGARDVAIDVRIVAATHRDLPRLIQEGQFREDLWYRLATFPIVLPPLRERRSDIPALAAHFARRAASRFGLRVQLPEAEDLVQLCAYDWPGNVRELAAVMDRAAILGEGERLEVAKALGTPAQISAPAIDVSQSRRHEPANSPTTLDEAMRRHIENVLAMTHGRVEGLHGAARILAINPHTLRARMRKLGIDWNRFKAPHEQNSI